MKNKVKNLAEERPKSPITYVLETQKIRTRQDLLKLRLAIDSAENIVNYDRELLHDIYRDVVKDPNLSSQWNSRKMKTKSKAFKIVKGEEEQVDKTKLFEAEWFFDFIDACLDSHLWGYTLIEFGPWDGKKFIPFKVNNKIYNPITVIERDNVKPEYGVVTDIPGNITGIDFDDPLYSKYLMFVGKHSGLDSILFKAAKYVLFKDNCLGNWSEWAEVFGMDKRVGYTRAQDEARVKFIKALRDLGSNAYGVFGQDDKIEYIGSARTDAFQVYKQMVDYIDQQISKLVFGQDVVTNNTGRVVGEVGENVANMYGQHDSLFIQSLVNDQLIPKLIGFGADLQGCKFMWDSAETLKMKERSEIDLKISQMGKQFSDDYIQRTYNVEIEEQEEEETESARIRNLYGVN